MIPNTPRRAGPYSTDGTVTTFPFAFKVFEGGDVAVHLTDSNGVASIITTGFTVVLNEEQDVSPGGDVVLTTAPDAGGKITILGDLDAEQPMQLTNSGGFFPTVLNDSADRAVILIQQLLEQAGRTITVPASDSSAPVLPAVDSRGGDLLGFSEDGTQFAAYPVGSFTGPKGDPGGTSELVGTKAQAQQMSIPENFDVIRLTGGETAGDGATGSSWKRRSTAPSHPGYFRDAAGTYWEIVGPVLPVEAFGAKGDCPDVSIFDPATQQTQIKAAIAGATNDAQAFQNAFKTAVAIGGGVVTYGHGKHYRIGYSPAGVQALVIGANTTFRRVGGGWLEIDPVAIDGTLPATPAGGFPANRGWPDPSITTGDPSTGYICIPTIDGNIVSSTLTDADFVDNVQLVDLDIRCHTRVYWHDLADQSSPFRRYRLYGTYLRTVRGCVVSNCYVKGLPNDGINITGLIDVTIGNNTTVEYCGYGSVNGTSTNAVSAIGWTVVNDATLSGSSLNVDGLTTRYNKDEGLAYAGIRGAHITNCTCKGDHDRAIEGIGGYSTAETDSSTGQDVGSNVMISDIVHDGRHAVTAGTISSGSTTLTVADAFYLNAFGESFGRYVFIRGAGAGGGDGPFKIDSIDYANNTVTLDTAASVSVSNALCFVYSRASISASDNNQNRVTIKGVKARNIYAALHAIYINNQNNGRGTIEDVELENASVPMNFNGVHIDAEFGTIDNIRAIACSGSSNSALAKMNADDATFRNISGDIGFAYAVRVAEFSTAKNLVIEDCYIGGTTLSGISLDYVGNLPYYTIRNNHFVGINSTNSGTHGFLRYAQASQTFGAGTVTGNFARFSGKTNAPLGYQGTAYTAGALGYIRIENNDFFDPQGLLYSGTVYSFNGNQLYYSTYIDRNNNLTGQRVMATSIPPTAGRWYAGDEVKPAYPVPGGAERARCTAGGNYASLYAADGTTAVTVVGAVSASATVTVSDATNIWNSDTIAFSTGPQTRRVISKAGNVLTLAATVTVPDGDTVSNATPVFKTATTLAS